LLLATITHVKQPNAAFAYPGARRIIMRGECVKQKQAARDEINRVFSLLAYVFHHSFN
jgi:hypothetical protein